MFKGHLKNIELYEEGESIELVIQDFGIAKNNPQEIEQKLFQKGVIVRGLKSYDLDAIRVTVGYKAR